MDNQLYDIRQKKHQEYLKHIEEINDTKSDEQLFVESKQIQNSCEIEENQNDNHQEIIDLVNKIIKLAHEQEEYYAASKLQKFIKKKYFEPICINEEIIHNIPVLFRIRINITEEHTNPYDENNISKEIIDSHRIIHQMFAKTNTNKLFRYCFDIRQLYPNKYKSFNLFGVDYYLQAKDHAYIESIWKKVNNTTNESIRYLTDFDYYKSLCIDSYKIDN
ncbi:hypothetical protein QLL95_gp1107 [Cotonvirus japonicus]|uniref:Uncharacterized protein n=1 Tax=Cotonvirus japonicus TaxID=2811091 RepID=A0ABM7NSD4_9VIRU|nr:hypothetical protein QLL95_gp1107 [Cotonvirus japonicus]BCS83016.1 hypothetical protein [Cotonvirus japonicus]